MTTKYKPDHSHTFKDGTRIELKSIKVVERLSEETHCYDASFYVNGKLIGHVSNRGHGGPDDVHFNGGYDSDLWHKISNLCNTELPPLTLPDVDPDWSSPATFESWCGDQVTNHLLARDFNRAMKSRVMFRDADSGDIMELRFKGTRTIDERHINHVRQTRPGVQLLHDMPIADAFALYCGPEQ